MLGKLIKYDFRSCWRKFWPFWLAIIITLSLCGVASLVDAKISSGGLSTLLTEVLPFLLLFFVFAATGVLALVYICRQFYTGLLGDPGYLMFTIPAKTWQLIASKGIVAVLVELLSFAATLVGGLALLLIAEWDQCLNLLEDIVEVFRTYNLQQIAQKLDLPNLILFAVLILLIVLAGLMLSNLRIYASIAIGHLARKNRVLLSIAAYVGIGIVMTVVLLVLAETGVVSGVVHALQSEAFSVNFTLGEVLFGELLVCAIYFFITHEILNHHLNLE